MKVSKEWLNDWLAVSDIESSSLAKTLTMAGLEVDDVEKAAKPFSLVVVGEVISCEPHPDAKRLSLCKVNVGKNEPLDIVCGASNVKSGVKVAVATVGAKLPNGLEIKEAVIRDAKSFGMLCAKSELGMSDESEGIWLLPEDAPVGEDIRKVFNLDNDIFEIELTPNRGDCLSIYGMAREGAALLDTALKKSNAYPEITFSSDKTISLEVNVPTFCPQYTGRVIEGVDASVKTPLWMSERLEQSGIRPKHFLVDVTNYVMLELGQPMHAFDLALVKDETIMVRQAKENEPLTLLNDKTVSLNDNTVVIADSEKALAIAGVMGGVQSAVSETTTTVLLESATFAKEQIAGVARAYGLHTDSSYRFERGVCPKLAEIALLRATSLILEIAGGKAGRMVSYVSEKNLPMDKIIQFYPKNITRLLGCEISEKEALAIFNRLGMEVYAQGEKWEVRVPSFRFDIQAEEDLIEEVARVYGYNQIPDAKTTAPFKANFISDAFTPTLNLANTLVSRGYHEVISYSFVCKAMQKALYGEKAHTLDLLNPISPELSQMRQGLWPGLINSALFNLNRQQNSFKLFETGLVFSLNDNDEVSQEKMIGGLLTGSEFNDLWCQKPHSYDFFDLKGDVEALLGKASNAFSFEKSEHLALHPGQQAKLVKNGEVKGYLGLIHPKVAKALGLTQNVYLFEIELAALNEGAMPKFEKISKFPLIRRDLSFIVDKSIKFEQIVQAVKAVPDGKEFFKDCVLFDVYSGEGIPDSAKSLAIGLTMQHPTRTLVDEEVNLFINAILTKLANDFNITLRE